MRAPRATSWFREGGWICGWQRLRNLRCCRFGQLSEQKMSTFVVPGSVLEQEMHGALRASLPKMLKNKSISSLCRDSNPFRDAWHLCCDNSARTPARDTKTLRNLANF